MKLFDYQEKALEFVLKNKKSALALETGMGKTITSLLYLKVLDVPAIIITPASIKKVWLEENKKFDFDLQISIDYNAPSKILLVSYDWIKYHPEVLNDFNVVILDEALCISNVNTVRYKNLAGLLSQKDRVLLLMGYPIENKLNEIFVLSLVTNKLGKNYYSFLYKNFRVIKRNNVIIKTIPKTGTFRKIINTVSDVMFMADKSQIFSSPIKKENCVVRFPLSVYQEGIIDSLITTGKYTDDKISIKCKSDLAVFGKLMQVVSGFIYNIDGESQAYPIFFDENPKLNCLEKIISNQSNFLLWFFYDAELVILNKFKSFCRLSKLQTNSRGLNLQSYKFSIYYTTPLSGGQLLQSQDRLYRIGRKTDVVSIFLFPEGNIGNRLLEIMERKQKLTKKFIKSLLKCRKCDG